MQNDAPELWEIISRHLNSETASAGSVQTFVDELNQLQSTIVRYVAASMPGKDVVEGPLPPRALSAAEARWSKARLEFANRIDAAAKSIASDFGQDAGMCWLRGGTVEPAMHRHIGKILIPVREVLEEVRDLVAKRKVHTSSSFAQAMLVTLLPDEKKLKQLQTKFEADRMHKKPSEQRVVKIRHNAVRTRRMWSGIQDSHGEEAKPTLH